MSENDNRKKLISLLALFKLDVTVCDSLPTCYIHFFTFFLLDVFCLQDLHNSEDRNSL